jgi:arginine exporter protein ArgO
VIIFIFGLLFGLATAFPVGLQSFVVMNQGLRFGYPRVLTGIITASLCDTLLILLGAAGASALQRRLTAPTRLWMQHGSGVRCWPSQRS